MSHLSVALIPVALIPVALIFVAQYAHLHEASIACHSRDRGFGASSRAQDWPWARDHRGPARCGRAAGRRPFACAPRPHLQPATPCPGTPAPGSSSGCFTNARSFMDVAAAAGVHVAALAEGGLTSITPQLRPIYRPIARDGCQATKTAA